VFQDIVEHYAIEVTARQVQAIIFHVSQENLVQPLRGLLSGFGKHLNPPHFRVPSLLESEPEPPLATPDLQDFADLMRNKGQHFFSGVLIILRSLPFAVRTH